MFTGIVEGTATVEVFEERETAWRLVLDCRTIAEGVAIGDSVACNGCCLTVVERQGTRLHFDLLEESIRLTNLQDISAGSPVNLERSLAANARLGGHFVTGHIDGLGTIEVFEPRGKNHYLKVSAPAELLVYSAYKGSIALDGISLTIAEDLPDGIAVWLIPHTIAVTNLRDKKPGDRINLEFDLLAKYAAKILRKERNSQ